MENKKRIYNVKIDREPVSQLKLKIFPESINLSNCFTTIAEESKK